ncbi:MAG: STM4012 family radical SAM protein [Peptostreptococcaceae bacterium]|nr:STM4012 family radical SAM protein [Peptostreptococcaceae bacterium]
MKLGEMMDYKNLYNQYMYSYPHKRTYSLIERLDLSDFKNAFVNRTMGLYFHIPFCRSKCGFCNLFSVTNVRREDYSRYIDAIERHSKQMRAEINLEQTEFTSLVLGGGTPLILSPRELERLFVLAQDDYRFDFEKRFSVIESSPREVNLDKLKLLKKWHIKRISMGVQSFVEEELRLLERFEEKNQTLEALEQIKKFDFEILNVDLIYGIPNQSAQSFLYSLRELMRFQPEEVFLYPLYKQENARLYHKFEMDHKQQYALYQIGRDFLKSEGYHQLSMRSFAKKPAQNADCGFENTLSLGCGGRSYFDNLHFCEPYVSEKSACESEYQHYLKREDFLANLSFYDLNLDERKRKYAIKNLLYRTGLSLADYKKHFGGELLQDFGFLGELLETKDLICREGRIFLSEQGLGKSDAIGPLFMSEKVKEKMYGNDLLSRVD